MGGSAGSQTTNTSSLPEYAEPFYTGMMEKAEALSDLPYEQYDQNRIAGFSGDQLDAFGGVQDLSAAGNPALGGAIGYSGDANAMLLDQAGQADPLQNTYNGAPGYDTSQYGGYGVDASSQMVDPSGMNVGTDTWNTQFRDQYMSPYIDGVVDRQQEDALQQDQRQQIFRNTDAVNAGAFGGDRRFVSDAIYGEELLDRQDRIMREGMEGAYNNAQGMFTSDRARMLQASQGNQNTQLQGGLGNLDAYMRGEIANQGAGQEAAALREQSSQFGADLNETGRQFGSELDYRTGLSNEELRLQSMQQLLEGTEIQGKLGVMDQGAQLERSGALADVGAQQQAQQQDVYDRGYEDFINQRDYDRNSIGWLSSILQGVPVSAQSNTVNYQSQPNLISQMLGSGIAGYGLYDSMSNT